MKNYYKSIEIELYDNIMLGKRIGNIFILKGDIKYMKINETITFCNYDGEKIKVKINDIFEYDTIQNAVRESTDKIIKLSDDISKSEYSNERNKLINNFNETLNDILIEKYGIVLISFELI